MLMTKDSTALCVQGTQSHDRHTLSYSLNTILHCDTLIRLSMTLLVYETAAYERVGKEKDSHSNNTGILLQEQQNGK